MLVDFEGGYQMDKNEKNYVEPDEVSVMMYLRSL